jgi:hypothetical protein
MSEAANNIPFGLRAFGKSLLPKIPAPPGDVHGWSFEKQARSSIRPDTGPAKEIQRDRCFLLRARVQHS